MTILKLLESPEHILLCIYCSLFMVKNIKLSDIKDAKFQYFFHCNSILQVLHHTKSPTVGGSLLNINFAQGFSLHGPIVVLCLMSSLDGFSMVNFKIFF